MAAHCYLQSVHSVLALPARRLSVVILSRRCVPEDCQFPRVPDGTDGAWLPEALQLSAQGLAGPRSFARTSNRK